MGQGWVNARRVPGRVMVRGVGTQLDLLTVITARVGFGDGAVNSYLNKAWGWGWLALGGWG